VRVRVGGLEGLPTSGMYVVRIRDLPLASIT